MKEYNIVKSQHGPYYEMYRDGIFAGSYDSVTEAAQEIENERDADSMDAPYKQDICEERRRQDFYLRHMRWGVRKYLNHDKSLTEAGKKRYGYDEYRNAKG